MANLLLSPELWTGAIWHSNLDHFPHTGPFPPPPVGIWDSGDTPAWEGEFLNFSYSPEYGPRATFVTETHHYVGGAIYNGPVSAGDVIAGTYTALSYMTGGEGTSPQALHYYSAEGDLIGEVSGPVGVAVEFEFPAVEGGYLSSLTTEYGYFGEFVITPTPDTPTPPDPNSRPWWLCVRPNPPEPCPVRINPAEEFVPFYDYDADFKFPLASSRKSMKIKRPTDCIVCAPTLIDEVPLGY